MRSGFGQTLEELFPEQRGQGYQFQGLPDGPIEVEDPTGGMVTSLPRAETPMTSWFLARNARSRDDWTGTRPGTSEIGEKPDSLPITTLLTMITENGGIAAIRLTGESAFLSWGEGQWAPLSHDLTGVGDRMDHARMYDWLFLANGLERIRRLDVSSMSLQIIPGAPRALTVASFADRIVAANLRLHVGGPRPSGIAWSANADPFDWDDLSAGQEDLIQGQGGFGDPIVRLIALENLLVILRRHSIWAATRQPFATAPFRFDELVSGVGCDMPHTAVKVEGGIIFADQHTKAVYFWAPGSRPQKISKAINKDLFMDLQSLHWAQAVYDPFEKEYHLGLATSVAEPWITKVWVFNLEKGAWTYDDGPIVSSMAMVSLPSSVVTIDDLEGLIDELEGTIDELNPGGVLRPRLYKGTATGEFIEQGYAHRMDWDESEIEWEVISQNLGSPSKRRTLKDVLVKVVAPLGGSIEIAHSANGQDWRNEKLVGLLERPDEQRPRLPKKLTTSGRLHYRLLSRMGPIRMTGWWVRLLEKGHQR